MDSQPNSTHETLVEKFEELDQVSFFESKLVNEYTVKVLSQLRGIKEPNKFNQFMSTRSEQTQKIIQTLEDNQIIDSSDQIYENKIEAVSKELIKLIAEYKGQAKLKKVRRTYDYLTPHKSRH